MAKCRWSKSDTLVVHAPSTARLNLDSWGVHVVRQWGQCVTYKFDTHDQAINYKIAYLADQRITGQQPIQTQNTIIGVEDCPITIYQAPLRFSESTDRYNQSSISTTKTASLTVAN